MKAPFGVFFYCRRNESGSGLTSDTKGENPVPRVRTLGNFGHKRRKSSAQSQNLGHLRTEKAKIQCSKSEPPLRKWHLQFEKYVSTRTLRVIKRGQRITNMLQIRKDSH